MIVTGLFPTEDALQKAVVDLESSGFDRADVGVLTSGTDQGEVPYEPESAGAAAGGWIGGLAYVAAAAAAGTVILAGGGLGLAIAALAGAGGAGGLVGALVAGGFHHEHAEHLEAQLAEGGPVLWVKAEATDQLAKAKTILTAAGATQVLEKPSAQTAA